MGSSNARDAIGGGDKEAPVEIKTRASAAPQADAGNDDLRLLLPAPHYGASKELELLQKIADELDPAEAHPFDGSELGTFLYNFKLAKVSSINASRGGGESCARGGHDAAHLGLLRVLQWELVDCMAGSLQTEGTLKVNSCAVHGVNLWWMLPEAQGETRTPQNEVTRVPLDFKKGRAKTWGLPGTQQHEQVLRSLGYVIWTSGWKTADAPQVLHQAMLKLKQDFEESLYKSGVYCARLLREITPAQMEVQLRLKILLVGESGSGKSSMGNFMVQKKLKGDFQVSGGHVSCTQECQTSTGIGGLITATDTPGLPDTNPENTLFFYDKVVREAKEKYNVIVFVFKYDRLEPRALQQAGLLLRELNQATPRKVLVLNNKSAGLDDSPTDQPTDDEFKEAAKLIQHYALLTFDLVCWVKGKDDFRSKVSDMVATFFQIDCPFKPSPIFRDFADLEAALQEYKDDNMRKEAALQEVLTWFDRTLPEGIGVCGGLGTLAGAASGHVLTGGVLACVAGGAIFGVAGLAGAVVGGAVGVAIKDIRTDKDAFRRAVEEASERLILHQRKFEELRKLLRCDEDVAPYIEENAIQLASTTHNAHLHQTVQGGKGKGKGGYSISQTTNRCLD